MSQHFLKLNNSIVSTVMVSTKIVSRLLNYFLPGNKLRKWLKNNGKNPSIRIDERGRKVSLQTLVERVNKTIDPSIPDLYKATEEINIEGPGRSHA